MSDHVCVYNTKPKGQTVKKALATTPTLEQDTQTERDNILGLYETVCTRSTSLAVVLILFVLVLRIFAVDLVSFGSVVSFCDILQVLTGVPPDPSGHWACA